MAVFIEYDVECLVLKVEFGGASVVLPTTGCVD